MVRHILWAVLWSGLSLAAWRAGVLIWVPFLGLAAYNLYRAVMPVRALPVRTGLELPPDAPLGALGRYTIDSTEVFGLFIELGEDRVFMDIREDEQVEARKARAIELFENAAALEASLAKFRRSHPEYSARKVGYICSHAPDLRQCEVFWDPEGYTLLRELEFVNG